MITIFNSVGRIVFGGDALMSLGEEIGRLGGRRALLVTDAGIRAAGILDRAVAALEAVDVERQVFSDVTPEPGIEVAEASLVAARAFAPDVVVGLGGGSSLDIAKVTAVLLTSLVLPKNAARVESEGYAPPRDEAAPAG